jgi:hypothetical protein
MAALLPCGKLFETDFHEDLEQPLPARQRKLLPVGMLRVHHMRLLSD